jgi:hypothetical protein
MNALVEAMNEDQDTDMIQLRQRNDISIPTFFALVPKKVELLIRFFEPFWISRVFHFSLRTFGEVEPHPEPLGASDETYTQSKFDISGSNETMQNALASIV